MTNQHHNDLPVWLYWEGDLPAWIGECQKTIFAHTNNVHLLTNESFNELRDIDLDIKLENLCVAHRADFIRAFLLYKYGGLWIDSDCIVLKPLQPLMDTLNFYEFVGYRERSGEVTNNFMGASFNSSIAKDYYNKVCEVLRVGQTIEWLTLGSKALTSILNESQASWFELNVAEIQPICWSDPGAFFRKSGDEVHERFLNLKSYCYMLSANMVRGFLQENDYPNLLDSDTFFSYLIRVSESNRQMKQEMMNDLSNIAHRKDTDDDRWVIPEVIEQDMYCVKSKLAGLEPEGHSYVIDCGAHIGAFSIMCAKYLKNVDVISFEPNPDSYFYLHQNAGIFGKIEALNKAVSINDGTLNLYSPDQSDWSGRWTSLPNSNEFLSVESVGLFSFIKQLDKEVFILKLDIEGYEELLFEATEEDDFKNIRSIIVETHTDNFNHQKLKDYGYSLLFNPSISAARQFVYFKN